MKNYLKEKVIEAFKILFVIVTITISSTIVLYPLIVEPKQKDYLIVLHIFAGILIGFLFWFCWSYTSHVYKEKDWSIKNFYKNKLGELSEAKKVTVNLFKSLFWICLMMVAIVATIIAIIFLGWAVASLSATTVIIVLLILILFKK